MTDEALEAWKTEGVWVGEWFVEPHCNRLQKDGETVQVEPKIMEILVCLIESEGTTVTKEQFLERVWSETVVTEDVLTRGISELRKVLGDDPNDPQYVETIHKTGYRLLATVSSPNPDPAPSSSSPDPESDELTPSQLPSLSLIWCLLKGQARQLLQRPIQLWYVWGILAVVVAVFVGGITWLLLPSPSSPLPTSAPFTSFPGKELDPALAPNGKKLAFAWTGNNADTDTDIYVKQTDVGSPLRLTRHPARDYSPAWSPDAQRVAFVRADDDRYSIHLTPLIGGNTRELLHFEDRRIQGLTWTTDGESLLFSAREAPYGPFCLYRLSIETTKHRALTDPPDYYYGDLMPSIGPKQGTVAFVRGVTPNVKDVYTVSTEGGTPRRLTNIRTSITGLDWSAKGQSVVYAVPSRTPRLWRVSAGGGSPSPLPMTGVGNNVHQPSIAQTGHMALTQRSVNVNIWRLGRQKRYNRFTKEPIIESTRWDSNPAISPNGKRIAFSSRRSGRLQIWVTSQEGTSPTRLTALDAPLIRSPRWSPDGNRIAFMARSDNQSDIYLTSTSGNSSQKLTTSPAEDVAPSWAADDDSLYFASNRSGNWQIWATATDSAALGSDRSSARQVTTNGGFAAREAPNGEALFVVRKRTAGIWRVPKDGSAPTRVVDALEPYDWGNWDVTEYGLYFVRRDADRPVLSYYSFESERIFRMAFLDDLPRTPSLAVAPGGEWFLYSRNQSQSDILLVKHTSKR